MRKAGLIARQNFSCCGGCGGGELETLWLQRGRKAKGGVFYHSQAAARLRKGDDLNLIYGQFDATVEGVQQKSEFDTTKTGEVVVQCLRDAGLVVEWNGDPDRTVEVKATEGGR